MKWVVLAVNALFLVVLIAGIAGTEPANEAEAAGAGIGVLLLVFLWAAVDVILGVIYLVTRKR